MSINICKCLSYILFKGIKNCNNLLIQSVICGCCKLEITFMLHIAFMSLRYLLEGLFKEIKHIIFYAKYLYFSKIVLHLQGCLQCFAIIEENKLYIGLHVCVALFAIICFIFLFLLFLKGRHIRLQSQMLIVQAAAKDCW